MRWGFSLAWDRRRQSHTPALPRGTYWSPIWIHNIVTLDTHWNAGRARKFVPKSSQIACLRLCPTPRQETLSPPPTRSRAVRLPAERPPTARLSSRAPISRSYFQIVEPHRIHLDAPSARGAGRSGRAENLRPAFFKPSPFRVTSPARSRREPSPDRTPGRCSSDPKPSTHPAQTTH